MTQYFDGIAFPMESPQCVICLKETGVMKLKERSEWDWNEDCLFKVFEIEPCSFGDYQSLAYFCNECSIRNKNLLELCSQINLLQQSLQEMKLTLESDFRKSFRFEGDHEVTDRSGFLRYQLAKRLKILPEDPSPPNQNFKPGNTTLVQLSREASEDSFLRDKLTRSLKAGSDNFPTPSHAHNPTMISNKPGNADMLLTESKVKRKTGRKATKKKALDNAVSQFPVNHPLQEMKLKDVKIKILVIPSDILSNPPVNVHTIPGYVPTPIARARGTGSSKLKIEKTSKAKCDTDLQVASDNDMDFNVEDYLDADNTDTTIKAVRKSRKRPSKIKQVKCPKTENQKMQVLETVNSTKAKKSVKHLKNVGKGYPHTSRYGVKCPLPECANIKGFSSKERLEVHHKKVHEGITHPFKCEECGRKFQLPNVLRFHFKSVHLGQFSFKCDFCGKGFISRRNLEKHRVTHTGERNFKCPECPLDFKTPHGRVLHIRYAHTGERPYTCDICGKGFVSTTKLSNHLKCVHHREERPVICHICGKNFPIQGYLYMHMRTHEKEDAAAAGLPVIKTPRWKKKSETTVEECLPNESVATAINNHNEEARVYQPEQISLDAEALLLS